MTEENKQQDKPSSEHKDENAAKQSSSAKTASKSQRKQRTNPIKRLFWYLVLVIIIATIAWVVVEKPYQQFGLDFSSAPAPVSSEPDEQQPTFDARQSVQQLSQQVERLQDNLTGLQNEMPTGNNTREVNQLQQRLNDVSSTVQQQRQQLEQLAQQLPEQQFEQVSRWRLFEAKQTVSAAARLIWGAEDYAAALKLLTIADKQLAGIETATAIQIRQLLAADIARVEAVAKQQPNQIALTLSGLQQRLKELPNRVTEKQLATTGSKQPVSSDVSDWRSNLASNWDDFLNTFIRIQPSVSNPEPLLTEAQRQAISLRLDLLLTMAQHATLKNNSSLWKTYLDQALPLIDELKGNSQAVDDVKSRLNMIREQSLTTQTVRNLESLDALTNAVGQGGLQ